MSGDRSIWRSVSWMRSPPDRSRDGWLIAVGWRCPGPAPAIQAPLDGRDESRELADALAEAAKPGELVADPCQPSVDIADGAERLAVSASSSASRMPPTCVVAPACRISCNPPNDGLSPAHGFDHLGGERLPLMDLTGIDARLDVLRRGPATVSRRPRGDQARTLSNSRSSSVCVSMSIRDPRPLASGANRFTPRSRL